MKIVKVTYTAKQEYMAQNSENIRAVMNDLQQLNHPGIHYHVCLGQNGLTFTHNAFFESEATQKILFELESFKHFQEQLKKHGLDTPPQQELLTLVGTSNNILQTN